MRIGSPICMLRSARDMRWRCSRKSAVGAAARRCLLKVREACDVAIRRMAPEDSPARISVSVRREPSRDEIAACVRALSVQVSRICASARRRRMLLRSLVSRSLTMFISSCHWSTRKAATAVGKASASAPEDTTGMMRMPFWLLPVIVPSSPYLAIS